MTKKEVRNCAYKGHNGAWLFDGCTAGQWFDIALERDERQESPDVAFTIFEALNSLEDEDNRV